MTALVSQAFGFLLTLGSFKAVSIKVLAFENSPLFRALLTNVNDFWA